MGHTYIKRITYYLSEFTWASYILLGNPGPKNPVHGPLARLCALSYGWVLREIKAHFLSSFLPFSLLLLSLLSFFLCLLSFSLSFLSFFLPFAHFLSA